MPQSKVKSSEDVEEWIEDLDAEEREELQELKKEELKVVLGFVDERVGEGEEDIYVTKLGGAPVWLQNNYEEEQKTAEKCAKCGDSKSLVLQAYAPLEFLPQSHRIIYIFYCLKCKE